VLSSNFPTPAYQAGFQKEDRIVGINGETITTWDEMARFIKKSKGSEIAITVMRDGERITKNLTPELKLTKNIFGEDVERYMIGVAASGNVISRELSFAGAFIESFRQTYKVTEITFLSVVKMIQGRVSKQELGGPIMIAKMAGDQARVGISSLVSFIAVISINLAILNFLPIPILDGGHLVFFSIEAIKGSPVSTGAREKAQQVGMFLLLFLMIFVFYNDLARVFSG